MAIEKRNNGANMYSGFYIIIIHITSTYIYMYIIYVVIILSILTLYSYFS